MNPSHPLPARALPVLLIGLANVAMMLSPAAGYEPTSNYTIRQIEGWKVYVNNQLLGQRGGDAIEVEIHGEKMTLAELGDRAIEKLHVDLAAVAALVDDQPLAKLREAPIWLEVDSTNGPHGRTPVFHYHPGVGWLIKMDFNPEKHQCVELSRATSYVGSGRSTGTVLHELAHAYHDRVFGFQYKPVFAAYKRHLTTEGYPAPNWAKADQMEFFCAVTDRYFGTAEEQKSLRQGDPELFETLTEMWNAPKVLPDGEKSALDVAKELGIEAIEKRAKQDRDAKATTDSDVRPPFRPTSQYLVKDLAGWTTYVDPRLLGEEIEIGRAALDRVEEMLNQIVRDLPPAAVDQMRKTALWIEMDNDHDSPCACYHGDEGWLRRNGYNPEKAKAVEICNAARFLRWSKNQPMMMLHELTHAYEVAVVRKDDELFGRLKTAYQKALDEKKYESVLRYHGRQTKHYAASNVAEYFAESTEAYFGQNDYYPFVRAELMQHDPDAYVLMREIWKADAAVQADPIDYRSDALAVTEVPRSERDRLNLDPLYTKYVSARGFPVVGFEEVSDYALLEAGYLINRMLVDRPDVREALIKNKVRFVVIPAGKYTSDIPEYSDLHPNKFWDRRARGLGPTPIRPAVSCGEENLLGYKGDPYRTENILIHEFAHAIHLMGIRTVDPDFDKELEQLYKEGMEHGLYQGKYAANNKEEYFAEAVQSYFGTNRKPDHDHNHVDTPEELREYAPKLYELVAREFRNARWQYCHPLDRDLTGHLAGYDPEKSPQFAWPKELLQWYANYEKEQKEEEKRREGEE